MSAGSQPEYGSAFSASRARAGDDELADWLAFALAACDDADVVALGHFRREIEIHTKPDRSFVTEADQAIERLIRERIQARYPAHGLVGEEYGEAAGSSGPGSPAARWYIDPIDGTHNYIRGVPLFGSLLALEVDGEIQVGVLSAPALRERWYASRGGGAWAVGSAGTTGPRRIRTSAIGDLADAQILYGSGHDVEESGRAPGFRGLLKAAWRERGFGDFWGYALLAEGAAEGMVEVDVRTWDLAAPLVLIEEAGGRVTDFAGVRRIDGLEVIASNGILHDELVSRLRSG